MKRILVIDDEKTSQLILTKVLTNSGFSVLAVSSGQEALKEIRSVKYDIVLTDLNMPEMNGIELTKKLLRIEPDVIVILITAYGTIRSAVEAIRLGAFEYLTKPVDNKELFLAINKGIERIELIKENILLKRELEKVEVQHEYLTENEKMQDILGKAKLLSKSDSPVLISGENGTGKEVLAKYIHDNSARNKNQFIIVKCASIPENLIETELFGYSEVLFREENKDKKGYFEIADNGTIFLDEISKISPMLQIKLVKVLQEKQFTRQGDSKNLSTNARVIASTSFDLKKLIKQESFNEDLYYKINVFEFNMPSLRDRPEDAIYYFSKFVNDYAKRDNKTIKEIEPDVKRLIINYMWPGNISELKNVAERVTILCEGDKITKNLLPEKILEMDEYRDLVTSNDFNTKKGAVIREFEISFIKKFLKLNRGNVTATARDINFHPVTLRQKITKLGIDCKEFKNGQKKVLHSK